VEVSISNCGVIAKTLYPNGPDIRTDDGHVDIWVLSMDSFFDYVRYVLGVAFRRRAKAQFLTAEKSIAVASRVPLTVQADGDIIGTTPLQVEILPGALTVLVPKPSA
jgi:diacylglycerol kinase family enzyme